MMASSSGSSKIVVVHSNAPAESNAICRRHAGELHTEGGYFGDNWSPPQNPIDPSSARSSVSFHDVGDLSREEQVRRAIEVVDQQSPKRENTTMSNFHGQNQPQQQHTQLPPSSSSSSESYQTASSSGSSKIVAAHSNAPAESNAVCRRDAGELHTEGGYFEDDWCPPQNPIDHESARLSVLFHDVGYLSREENVPRIIEVVDQTIT